MPRTGLTARRQAFVTEYVYGQHAGNATQSAKAAGFKAKALDRIASELLSFPEVRAEVDRLQAEKLSAIKAEGVARLENRLADYNLLRDSFDAIRQARGKTMQKVDGGGTGFVTRTYRTVIDPKTGNQTSVMEEKVDTGLSAEWRNTLKQAATELGQWAERKEHTGKDGGPLEVSFTFGIQSANRVGQLTDGDNDSTG